MTHPNEVMYGKNGSVTQEQQGLRREWLKKVSQYAHRYFDAFLGTGPYEGELRREPVGPGLVVPGDSGNLISSEIVDPTDLVGCRGTGEHTVALDIDFPVHVEPSSTPGHYHLFIDHKMSWDDYAYLLNAMGAVGLLEEGYVRASTDRKATHLRLPWVLKDDIPAGPELVDGRIISPFDTMGGI